MFEKKTVFVVGAGASKEFGMPTGDDLRNEIAALISREAAQSNAPTASDFRSVLVQTIGPNWQTLQGPGIELSAALPSFVSIDEALHYFSSNDKIVSIGKLAIAYILLKYERESKIKVNRNTGKPSPHDCSKTWLAELFSMALSFAKRETVKDAFANVHFINFNYDRVIERYIGAALTDLAGINSDEAEAIATTLNMVRPYGDLGPLDIPNRKGIPFGYNPHQRGGLKTIADGIRTYTEQMKDGTVRSQIAKLMHDAGLVIFIGFGFHQQNVALLRSSGRYKPVFATASGIDRDNYDLFSKNLTEFFGDNIRLFDKKGFELMSDLRPTISAAASVSPSQSHTTTKSKNDWDRPNINGLASQQDARRRP
jgi:hypothetical protein